MKDIKEFLKADAFSLLQQEKENKILPIIKEQLKTNLANNHMASYYKKIDLDIDKISSLSEIPFIPAAMFKDFELATVPKDEIIRVLKSSSTTGQNPSKVPLDKKTAIRQTIALNSILSNYLGKKRLPMLVFDLEEMNKQADTLTARGAGIRGFSSFAKEIVYVLKREGEHIKLDINKLKDFHDKHSEEPVFAFGFTYLIWQMLSQLDKNISFTFKNMKVFHGGGWKKLESSKVDKEQFNTRVANFLGTTPNNVYDFYGMVEQTGIIFIDCEEGNKHVPVFGDIIIRDVYYLKPVMGKDGLINVISVLPNSYPGQSILTEDKGILLGIDDCKCGRKGKYFRFSSRVHKTEIRGCGDTMPD